MTFSETSFPVQNYVSENSAGLFKVEFFVRGSFFRILRLCNELAIQ